MIERFILKDGNWIPEDFGLRSVHCPYTSVDLVIGFVLPARNVRLEVEKKGNGNYCWSNCDIEDCPAYKIIKKKHL